MVLPASVYTLETPNYHVLTSRSTTGLCLLCLHSICTCIYLPFDCYLGLNFEMPPRAAVLPPPPEGRLCLLSCSPHPPSLTAYFLSSCYLSAQTITLELGAVQDGVGARIYLRSLTGETTIPTIPSQMQWPRSSNVQCLLLQGWLVV